MTEGTDRARAAVQAQLRELHWSRAQLARTAGVDPNTIGDFLNGKRVPSDVTLSKLAEALGLTLGTPEDTGEDPSDVGPRDLADVSDEQLLSELGYRMFGLRREVGELRRKSDDQKRPDDDGGSVTPIRPVKPSTPGGLMDTAARTVKNSPGKRMAQESSVRGEESQDDGGFDPA